MWPNRPVYISFYDYNYCEAFRALCWYCREVEYVPLLTVYSRVRFVFGEDLELVCIRAISACMETLVTSHVKSHSDYYSFTPGKESYIQKKNYPTSSMNHKVFLSSR